MLHKENVLPIADNLIGVVAVLRPAVLGETRQAPAHQLIKVTGGAGAVHPNWGGKVYCQHLVDGSWAQYSRRDIIGIAHPAQVINALARVGK